MPHVFVIAEAGISHDGDLDKAFRLIEHAKSAKADAVKFQTFNAQRLAARRKSPDLFQKLKPYEMPLAWLPQLKKKCDDVGIEFMTTCFDEETLPIVAPFVKRFKIGHVEAKEQAFVEANLGFGKTVYASVLKDWRYPEIRKGPSLRSLHCIPQYPTPIKDARLELTCYTDGFSDHTRDEWMGGLAVAAGAEIVEVHFREWYTDRDNPDWCVSHDPTALIRYIEFLRQAQLAVYGEVSEETKKLERPGSSPHTSRPQASEESGPSAYHPAVEP